MILRFGAIAMRRWTPIAAAILGLALLAGCNVSDEAEPMPSPLPKLGAKIDSITLTGLSSGAYMAAQFQLAHAKMVSGVGLVAGGLFGCVESVDNPLLHISSAKAIQALKVCMEADYLSWGIPNARTIERLASRYAERGVIDPVASVADDRIYLFTGRKDTRVATAILDVAAEFYERVGVPVGRILFERDRIDAAHAFVTEAEGKACDVSESPYLVDCDYDQAHEILKHLLGPLTGAGVPLDSNYRVFDQKPFVSGSDTDGMGGKGVVYVPTVCARAAGCRVHIVLHGCSQNRDQIGDAFIRGSGFGRWAEANRIIVLFPQTGVSRGSDKGCWDWWGYTGEDYYTRNAPQIQAIRKMVERLGLGSS